MAFIIDLWLPIVASGVAVWFASALGWMLLNHHAKDLKTLAPDAESAMVALLKSHAVAPGVYGYPDFKTMKKTPPQGPIGLLRVWAPLNMAKPMLFSVAWFLLTAAVMAYLGHAALPKGAEFAKVMQVMGTAGVLGFAFGGVVCDVWFQNARRAMILNFVDGIVYGLIAGAIFAWLWPK